MATGRAGTGDEKTKTAQPAHAARKAPLCCIFWCREPAAIAVRVGEKRHLACRKHAAFMKAGKLDWFER
jgi:hypothetical protein